MKEDAEDAEMPTLNIPLIESSPELQCINALVEVMKHFSKDFDHGGNVRVNDYFNSWMASDRSSPNKRGSK